MIGFQGKKFALSIEIRLSNMHSKAAPCNIYFQNNSPLLQILYFSQHAPSFRYDVCKNLILAVPNRFDEPFQNGAFPGALILLDCRPGLNINRRRNTVIRGHTCIIHNSAERRSGATISQLLRPDGPCHLPVNESRHVGERADFKLHGETLTTAI